MSSLYVKIVINDNSKMEVACNSLEYLIFEYYGWWCYI